MNITVSICDQLFVSFSVLPVALALVLVDMTTDQQL